MDGKVQRRVEKTRRFEEKCVRWRWAYTFLFSFNLCIAVLEVWEKRAQWPGLLSLRALAQFRDFGSVEWNAYGLLVWSFLLVQTWVMVGRHQHEKARQEQERLMLTAASAEGVWPPRPTPPAA